MLPELGWSSEESFRFKNRIRTKYCNTLLSFPSGSLRNAIQSYLFKSCSFEFPYFASNSPIPSLSMFLVFSYFCIFPGSSIAVELKVERFFLLFHFIFPFSDDYEGYSILYNLVTSLGAVGTCKYVATRFLQVKLRLH